MTTKISRVVAQGFAAVALATAGFAAQAGCEISNDGVPTGCNGTPPATTPAAGGTGVGVGKGTGVGTGTGVGKVVVGDTTAGAVAKTGDLTAQQKLEAQQRQQAELQASQKTVVGNKSEVTSDNKLIGGDQKLIGGDQQVKATTGKQETVTQVDASDRSQTHVDARSSRPVEVQATSSTFLAVPNGKGECDDFEAEQQPKGGLGVQWAMDKSIGLTFDAGAKSTFKPNEGCLKDKRLHEARMLQLQLQSQERQQETLVSAQRDAAVYGSGPAGQMVVIQRNYAAEAEAVTKDGSAVLKLFNLTAPKPPVAPPAAAPAPVARKAPAKVVPAPAANCDRQEAALKACKAKLPAPGEK